MPARQLLVKVEEKKKNMKSGRHLSGRRDIGNGIILVHKLDDYKLKIAQFLCGPYIWNNIAEESILRVRILNYIALLKANYLSSKYVEYEFRICERSNNYVYLNIHILTVSDHIDVINYIKISASPVWGPNHEGKVALSQG